MTTYKTDAACAAVYDKTGRQILPGDTLKMYHFRAALRRERRYMYKYVTGYHANGKALEVSHLSLDGRKFWILLDGKIKQDIEIVQGYAGVKPGEDFRDRKQNKAVYGGGAPYTQQAGSQTDGGNR